MQSLPEFTFTFIPFGFPCRSRTPQFDSLMSRDIRLEARKAGEKAAGERRLRRPPPPLA